MVADKVQVQAIVKGLDSRTAFVEVLQGGCGRCHEKGGCGGQHLTQAFCSGPRYYQAVNDLGAKVGEQVTVEIAYGSLKRSANLAYGLPLVGLIGGALLGHALASDSGAIGGAIVGIALAWGALRYQRDRIERDAELVPRIVAHSVKVALK